MDWRAAAGRLDWRVAAGRPWAPWLLVLLCGLFFLPGFTTLPPMERDETRFAQASRQMLESGDFIDIRFQDQPRHKKPVGIYWLQAAAASLAGPSRRQQIWVYRLPSLLGAVLAVLGTAALGRLLFDRPTGILAGAIMASAILPGVEARLAKTDALLLACIVWTQWFIARAWLAGPETRHLPGAPIFWVVLAAGLLLKGPIILLAIAGAGLLLPWFRPRPGRWRWLGLLDPGRGLPLCLLLVLPWFIAIGIRTDGTFFTESVGRDLLGKIATGQESHGAPPGYYLATFWLTFWPWSLFAGAGLALLWQRRREPAVLFCLAQIVPLWLVFELTATKLLHYVLPAWPLIALAVAGALLTAPPARRFAFWIPAVLWGLVTLALAGAAIALPIVWGDGFQASATLPVLLGLVTALAGLLAFRQGRAGPAVAAILATAALTWNGYARLMPGLHDLWLSPRLAGAVEAHRRCPAPTAIAGYAEPGVVFLLGTETRLTTPGGAAETLKDHPCSLAAVEAGGMAAFTGALDGQPVERLDNITGFNLNGGDRLEIGLYRLAR